MISRNDHFKLLMKFGISDRNYKFFIMYEQVVNWKTLIILMAFAGGIRRDLPNLFCYIRGGELAPILHPSTPPPPCHY